MSSDNGTPRSSHLSPNSAALSPTWCPPKSPLPPHRLVKLANALGISAPIPANHTFLSRSFSESANSSDHLRRSPTPSLATSAMGYHVHSTSKFLLHVIPPHHLPHDSNDLDPIPTTPPPPNAPGYHVHFRRGTLLPVYPTLQAQLGAIAKEYALPSTTGLILYMISTPSTNSSSQPPDEMDEPGPRLSEEIWKHLWTRVLRIEQRDDLLMSSPALSPNSPYTPKLHGFGPATRSTPFLPQESSGHLRPFIASPGLDSLQPHAPQATYTSPSTASSLSDIRSMNKSAPPSESISPSEPGTPDTSVGDAMRANSIDLPGLTSPSLIPILAKVEFDIDRRKAGWYAPWIRSRKVNHAKRTENRKGSKSRENNADDEPGDYAPIELLTGKKEKRLSRTSLQDEIPEGGDEVASYAPLSESPEGIDSDNESANGESDCEDITARVSSLTGGKDPLDDVFGTDADTWADVHATNGRKSKSKNPHIVQLALTGAELAALPSQEDFDDDDDISTKEEDDVRELLDLMSRPNLAISIPSPPKNKRASSPIGINGSRKNLPPPLLLIPKDKSGGPVISTTPSPSPLIPTSLSSTNLAYLVKSSPGEVNEPTEEETNEFPRIRSPEESEKRGGAVFDDLDLGLDPTVDFDDSDPNDRRRSQYLMKAQLDEIERTMAQLSPRTLNTDLEDEQNMRLSSATLSPMSPGQSSLSPGRPWGSPSPSRLPRNPPEPPESPTDFSGQSWPAVPFASIKDKPNKFEGKLDGPPSPPCLAVNGVTTSAPRSYMPGSRPANDAQSETERRKKELEDEQALYPPIPPPKHDEILSSPAPIPLSPDPFGRYPSIVESSTSVPMGAHWAASTVVRSAQSTRLEVASEVSQVQVQGHPTTSRFSTDSVTGEELASIVKTSNRATLISVKSFKKLWRKSDNKKSISLISPGLPTQPTTSTPSSGRTSPMAPPRPERPSEEQLDLPDVSDLPPPARLSPQIFPSQPSVREKMHMSRRPSQDQHLALPPSRPSLDQLSSPIQLVHPKQLSAPLHPAMNRNSPITTTHPQPAKASNLDRLHFDQESPYPIHRSPPVRQSPRPPSPPLLPIPEQEKPAARKSILKWKSSTNHATNASSVTLASEAQPRSSFERPGAAVSSRGRRPSVINFGSTRASVTTPDPLPPSPQIPDHFVNKNGLEHRQSQRSKLAVSSAELYSPPPRQSSLGALPSSPPRSMASPHDSEETRPSLDNSHFEIIPAKSGGSLSYPYHAIDQC
ncbi:hypothetical protein BYT27DRAFT_7338569 [Phlegmacium glaucopus]|nr:hypothetical protein BYT27DRAFT_7338569 [Phlegmacium glaucopus]